VFAVYKIGVMFYVLVHAASKPIRWQAVLDAGWFRSGQGSVGVGHYITPPFRRACPQATAGFGISFLI
jgi:hypothetical protein